MALDIRLKTGFFETRAYEFLICKDGLVLSATETENDTITIPSKDILSITLKNEKAPEIEIQICEKIYQGSFHEEIGFERLIDLLKENLSVKIICEFEGGNDDE
ncbi:MAG: hypothetical protein AVO33_09850 [delta proteobacterium ML8_F1]|nr:MAG: hypothetical protein AVO33_09850 [delta proteobacterium ML8_F1]